MGSHSVRWMRLVLTSARQAGTRFTYSAGIEGWVGLCVWLYTEIEHLICCRLHLKNAENNFLRDDYSDCLLSQFFNASVTNLLINSVQICLLYFILWLNRYLGGSILKNFVVCSYNVLTDTTVSLDMILCHTVLLVIHVLVLEVFL